MKLLVRWSLTLGLAGSVMFAGILGINNLQALALPQEQVVKTLQEVPVFTLTNPKGEFVVENNKKKDSNVILTLVPTKQQVDVAITMLNTSGSPDKKFNGIPLFVPKLKKDNSYLTIPQGKNQLIPFYFEKEQAVAHLEAFKKAKPQEAANTEIQVLDLYRVIETLSSSNDPGTNKIFLFPSRESIEFIRSIVPNQPKK